MVATFKVKGAAATGAAGAAATGAAATPPAPTPRSTPPPMPAADWKPYDPALQPAPGGTEHALTMTATEVVKEVAPGVTQMLWTFNDQVPGPVLRGKVGDVFTVTLENKGSLGHSIDFHASQVAWNDEMRTIQPGESLVYQFKAEYAGIFMYHCGTAPTLHHIGNGMYGAIIIDPPNLAPVDHEYLVVQSELYLGPQGGVGDLTKMQQDKWDAVVFNGYFNQYKFAPIRVEPGDRIRVWVLDAGPSENSSFHVVGTIFNTVYKEGEYLLQPGAEPRRLPGPRPPARAGRFRRVHPGREGLLPDGDPQVLERLPRRPRVCSRPATCSWPAAEATEPSAVADSGGPAYCLVAGASWPCTLRDTAYPSPGLYRAMGGGPHG